MKEAKRRDEYWAAGVGYGHHNRPGTAVAAFDPFTFYILTQGCTNDDSYTNAVFSVFWFNIVFLVYGFCTLEVDKWDRNEHRKTEVMSLTM